MQNVRVMTDTLAGVPPEVADQHDIKVIPAGNITYEGRSYLDGVTITLGGAYDLLQKNPGKFQMYAVAPGYLLDVYRDVETASRDILFITISSARRAFHDPASLAAELYQREFNYLGMVMGEFSPAMRYATGPGTLSVGFHPELAAGDTPSRQLSS